MQVKSYTGMVEKIIPDGKHGPYAVASVDTLGSVTFSLRLRLGIENDLPEGGSIVILSGITKKRAGWRASQGRFLQPSDEQ